MRTGRRCWMKPFPPFLTTETARPTVLDMHSHSNWIWLQVNVPLPTYQVTGNVALPHTHTHTSMMLPGLSVSFHMLWWFQHKSQALSLSSVKVTASDGLSSKTQRSALLLLLLLGMAIWSILFTQVLDRLIRAVFPKSIVSLSWL